MAIVCTYDVARFSAAIVMDVSRTHPQAIVGGMLRDNELYALTNDFMREQRERGARAS
jgi:hypothetical protein